MMVLKKMVRLLVGFFNDIKQWSEEPEEARIEIQKSSLESKKTQVKEIHSIWDYLNIRENTQAHHLISVIGFEWVEMIEIRRRITEQFSMEYKNERSLYPYIKTFTDCGLFECSDVGGKRKWRKKNILISKAEPKQKQEERPIEVRKNDGKQG